MSQRPSQDDERDQHFIARVSDSPSAVRTAFARAGWIDWLAIRIARQPWWAIIILVGLVVAAYSMSFDAIYRTAFQDVTQNPKWSTNRIANIVYNVKQPDGSTKRVSGALTAEDDTSVKVITQDEVLFSAPRTELTSLSCEADKTGAACPVGSTVTAVRQSASGKLIMEHLGDYVISTPLGTQTIYKIGAYPAKEGDPNSPVRTPTGCSADPNGNCDITIKLKTDRPENQATGTLLGQDAISVTVQTVPPVIDTINKSDIVDQTRLNNGQCAANNLSGCNQGPFLTMRVTLVAFAIAILLGLTFGLMRVSSNVILFNLATVYVEVIRGIPLIVILLFVGFAVEPAFHQQFTTIAPTIIEVIIGLAVIVILYFVATKLSRLRTEPAEFIQPVLFSIVFAAIGVAMVLLLQDRSQVTDSVERSVQAGIAGLAIGYGAFLAELFRAGIQSIGKGQMEAARSLGMTYVQAMRFIILPQAFRIILPPLGNDFIAMLKDSALIAVLAAPELTQLARISSSRTYHPFQTYVTIGVIYLCMTLFLSLMVRIIERRVALPR